MIDNLRHSIERVDKSSFVDSFYVMVMIINLKYSITFSSQS